MISYWEVYGVNSKREFDMFNFAGELICVVCPPLIARFKALARRLCLFSLLPGNLDHLTQTADPLTGYAMA